jgi:hypothetical protein
MTNNLTDFQQELIEAAENWADAAMEMGYQFTKAEGIDHPYYKDRTDRATEENDEAKAKFLVLAIRACPCYGEKP